MENSRKQRLKDRRTFNHIINTCNKNSIGYTMYCHGAFYVQDFNSVTNKFDFSEESALGNRLPSIQSLSELRDKLDIYIKYHKSNEKS